MHFQLLIQLNIKFSQQGQKKEKTLCADLATLTELSLTAEKDFIKESRDQIRHSFSCKDGVGLSVALVTNENSAKLCKISSLSVTLLRITPKPVRALHISDISLPSHILV